MTASDRSVPNRRAWTGRWHLRRHTILHFEKRHSLASKLACLAGWIAVAIAVLLGYGYTVATNLPSLAQLENPTFVLAAVAYTSDGQELARYASENRTWTSYERISPHVINALIATEDHRFYRHGGIDVLRTVSSAGQTILAKAGISDFRTQGGSTITQQLARNLFNEQIGTERSMNRKLKEMATSVALERRYSKSELIELYLNTVQFGHRAYGIETAANTFFGKQAVALTLAESATLVGMLRAITRYNPIRNPENARQRRNQVLMLMAGHGFITQETYEEMRDAPVAASYHSSAIPSGPAPHFALVLKEWLASWGRSHGIDVFRAGLRVYTTVDSRLQQRAEEALIEQTAGLQAVVNYEWSQRANFFLGTSLQNYLNATGHKPFAHFWESRGELVDEYLKGTARFQRMCRAGEDEQNAISKLHRDESFMDSLKTAATRLEAGLVSIDPRGGQVRVWVGGRNILDDWNDHVAGTRRQPGSVFKPFVYATAIDNGWSPSYTLPDRYFTYTGPFTNRPWTPSNFGGASGSMMTLRRALATSNNLVTAQVMTELVTPPQVAFYARRMGIVSPLLPMASLGLGTSDVTLLELTAAYSTIAGGGRYFEPFFVSRIEDRDGNVLYERAPAPGREAISAETAYLIVDMLRDAVTYGTAARVRSAPYRLGEFDLAAKTGTTQNSADGWFMLMHPELVTGTWVGFNDRRVTFRSQYWGQGAHNALLIAGTFFRKAADAPDLLVGHVSFPRPDAFALEGRRDMSRLQTQTSR